MLHNLIASGSAGHRILEWIEVAALVIELLAAVIIVGAIFYALGHYLFRGIMRDECEDLYRQLKVRLGRALLLGLEILVAADIVRTVALEATLQSVLVLGLLDSRVQYQRAERRQGSSSIVKSGPAFGCSGRSLSQQLPPPPGE